MRGLKVKRLRSIFLCLLLISISFLPNLVQAKNTVGEEIIYNILVDRYNVGNQDKGDQVRIDDPYAYHGGDLKGITAKLGEIEELGHTTISISPIMKNAENGYHGYWIEDFYEIEEQFGTKEDLQTLVKEAHKRDIKVVLEFVTNYVAASHPYVQDESKEDWFKQSDVKPTDSTYWLNDVVELDQGHQEVAQYLLDVAQYWMDEVDIDGFNLHAIDQMEPDFLDKLVALINEKDPSFYLLGNILDPESPIEHFEELENVVVENYELSNEIIDVFSHMGTPVSKIHDLWDQSNQKPSVLFVDNEHMKRFSQTVAEEGRNSTTAWKLALTYMYTTPNTPFILQGSELTMYGDGFPETQRLVPFHSAEPDLEQFFYQIASLKKEFPSLQYGTYEQVATSGAMSIFKRSYEDETLYIAINNDVESQVVNLTEIESGKRLKGILNDNLARENADGTFTVGIPRESVEVYIIEEDVGFNWWLIGFISSVFLIFIIAVIYLSRKDKARSS